LPLRTPFPPAIGEVGPRNQPAGVAGRPGTLLDPTALAFVALGDPKRVVLVGSKSGLGLSGTVLPSCRPARDRRGKREPAGWDDSLNLTFAALPEAPLGAGPSAGFGMSRPSPSTWVRASGPSGQAPPKCWRASRQESARPVGKTPRPAPEGRGDASNGIWATLCTILRRYHRVRGLQVVAPVNICRGPGILLHDGAGDKTEKPHVRPRGTNMGHPQSKSNSKPN
jgi:hypothetical protein